MTAAVLVAVLLMILALLVGILLGYRRWRRFGQLSISDVRPYLEMLLRRGRQGAFVIVTAPTHEFVQFKKYIHRQGQYGLRMDLPNAPWSAKHFDQVQRVLNRSTMSFSLQPTRDEPITEFLVVDCHRDVDQAIALAEIVFFEVFGLDRGARFRVQSEDISYKDELIDTPNTKA